MALSINILTKTMRVAAGESIKFEYQPASAAGVPESLTGRAFVLSIYDAARVSRGYFDAKVIVGADPVVQWGLDGLVSEGLLSFSDLKWEIAERLNNSRDVIISGTFIVDMSAPTIQNYDSAPITQYRTRITRKSDPGKKPFFSTKMTPLVVPVPAPAFTAQPSISPTSGTVGQTFTANDGAVTNGAITARQWFLNGTAIDGATTGSYTSVAVGSLAYRATASGNGSVSATSADVTVSKAPAPSMSISSAVSKPEGNTGTSDYSWTVTLNRDGSPAAHPFSWVVSGTGTTPANAADFGGSFPNGSGVFSPGETSKTITVLTTGDLTVEQDETFALTVSATGLATVSSSGTIINDDFSVFSTGAWNDSAKWSDTDVWSDA